MISVVLSELTEREHLHWSHTLDSHSALILTRVNVWLICFLWQSLIYLFTCVFSPSLKCWPARYRSKEKTGTRLWTWFLSKCGCYNKPVYVMLDWSNLLSRLPDRNEIDWWTEEPTTSRVHDCAHKRLLMLWLFLFVPAPQSKAGNATVSKSGSTKSFTNAVQKKSVKPFR